jgi:hypothetical protein
MHEIVFIISMTQEMNLEKWDRTCHYHKPTIPVTHQNWTDKCNSLGHIESPAYKERIPKIRRPFLAGVDGGLSVSVEHVDCHWVETGIFRAVVIHVVLLPSWQWYH